MSIRRAVREDLTPVLELLAASGLPQAGVEDHFADYAVADDGGIVVGVVGMELFGEVGLLRSLAVRPDHRGGGLGVELALHALRQARARGLQEVYLLTTTAEGFFPRFGFQRIPRSEIHPQLGQSHELRGVCPDSAVCMRLRVAHDGVGESGRRASSS